MRERCGNPPVVIAGDVFDDGWRTHKCPPELINFAIKNIPKGSYAIPGQHDLPHHRYKDIRKSAYWTLHEAGVIKNLVPQVPAVVSDKLVIWGFPWEVELKKLLRAKKATFPRAVHLAVVHKYVWDVGNVHEGAKNEDQVSNVVSELGNFDAIVFGDNHKGFLHSIHQRPNVLNGGTFMRRRSDEAAYRPTIGLLLECGEFKRHELDTDKDKDKTIDQDYTIGENTKAGCFDKLMETLVDLGDTSLDFHVAVRMYLKKNAVPKAISDIITRSMDEK